MDVSQFLGGSYLKAADIPQPTNVTIREARQEQVGQGQDRQTKLVVYFNELQKGMVANKTNLGVIASLYGAHTEQWQGRPLQLYVEPVQFQGRLVPGIRVRAAAQQAPPTAAPVPAPPPTAAPASPAQQPWERDDQQQAPSA